MTKEQVFKLLLHLSSNESYFSPELIETHISWVILCQYFVYKIKKPIHYSFLDFSTIEKRKHYCEREIILNRRLTEDIYLDVQPIIKKAGHFEVGNGEGEPIDYVVRMRRLDRTRQMDSLLLNNKVTSSDIQKLAERIAMFHKNTEIIYIQDHFDISNKFNDLEIEKDYLEENLDQESYEIIDQAIAFSNTFAKQNEWLLESRLKRGFFRDCHGDLHVRNIFLLPAPQAFDCLEFNDDYRQIDVLNEVAFLCMDLEAFGRKDLSDLFIAYYDNLFPSITTKEDMSLFVYYKCYRANIRAKVNSLRARNAESDLQKKVALNETGKYLYLMNSYINQIEL